MSAPSIWAIGPALIELWKAFSGERGAGFKSFENGAGSEWKVELAASDVVSLAIGLRASTYSDADYGFLLQRSLEEICGITGATYVKARGSFVALMAEMRSAMVRGDDAGAVVDLARAFVARTKAITPGIEGEVASRFGRLAVGARVLLEQGGSVGKARAALQAMEASGAEAKRGPGCIGMMLTAGLVVVLGGLLAALALGALRR